MPALPCRSYAQHLEAVADTVVLFAADHAQRHADCCVLLSESPKSPV